MQLEKQVANTIFDRRDYEETFFINRLGVDRKNMFAF